MKKKYTKFQKRLIIVEMLVNDYTQTEIGKRYEVTQPLISEWIKVDGAKLYFDIKTIMDQSSFEEACKDLELPTVFTKKHFVELGTILSNRGVISNEL